MTTLRVGSTPTRARRALAGVLLAVSIGVASVAVPGTSAPAAADEAQEAELLSRTNQSRAANGKAALSYDPAASSLARSWAGHLAATGRLEHNPNLVQQVEASVTTQWSRLGENVGYAGSVQSVHDAFMGSSGHRANILGDYNRVGIGVVNGGGRVWAVVVFIKGPAITGGMSPSVADVGAVTRSNGRVEVVERTSSGELRIRSLVNGSWTAWTALGGYSLFAPEISAWGTDRLDVFIVGGDGALWQRTQTSSGWGPWVSLGGRATAAPAAVSTGTGSIELFVRGGDAGIWRRTFANGGWSAWSTLGGLTPFAPELASRASGTWDLFVIGGDGAMWHRGSAGAGVTGWRTLGGRFTAAPGVAADGADRLTLIGRGGDGALWAQHWVGDTAGSWYTLGGALIGAPEAASSGDGRVDVVVRGTDNRLFTRQTSGSSWSGWAALP